MSSIDFHVLVRADIWNEMIDELTDAVDGSGGSLELMARRREHAIFRVNATSDTYLFFLLKYGKDQVWKR